MFESSNVLIMSFIALISFISLLTLFSGGQGENGPRGVKITKSAIIQQVCKFEVKKLAKLEN